MIPAPRRAGSGPPHPKRVEERMRRHEAVYRSLMRLYPGRFRRRYAPEMIQVFRDRLRAAADSGGRGRVAALWARTAADVARSSVRQRVGAVAEMDWRSLSPTGGRSGMSRYVARRLAWSVPVLLVASVIVFVVIRTTVDPFAGSAINPRITPEDILRMKRQFGLDRPLYVQYWKWLEHFVRGDWGRSLLSRRAVFPDVRTALSNTLILGMAATALSLLIGIGIGLYSSIRQYSVFDHLSTSGAFFGLSIPNFWFALLLQIFFGLYLTRWLHLGSPVFPTAGLYTPGREGFDLVDRVRHLVLPVMVLSVQEIAGYSRYMRSSMLEVMGADYLRTARAKGLRERRVIARHAVRNALIPVTTVASLSIGAIAGGLIITEAIFEYPGMGRLFVDAMRLGDYLVVLPWLMVAVTFVIVANLMADIVYAFLDPRIRFA